MPQVRFFQLVNSAFSQQGTMTTTPRTGIAQGGETVWLLGAGTVPMYRWAAPFTLAPIQSGVIGIYSGGVFQTYTPGVEHMLSAVTWGVSGTAWAASVDNQLYEISGGTLTTSTIPPYGNQSSGVPLGISALVWGKDGNLYGASALNGLLAKLAP